MVIGLSLLKVDTTLEDGIIFPAIKKGSLSELTVITDIAVLVYLF